MVKVKIVQTENEYIKNSRGEICDSEVIDSEVKEYSFDLSDYEEPPYAGEEELVYAVRNTLENHGFMYVNSASDDSFDAYAEPQEDYNTGNYWQTYMKVEGNSDLIKKILDKLNKKK